MSKRDLFMAISLIDDDIIAEANLPKKTFQMHRIKKSVLIAAIVVALFGITVWAANLIIVSRSSCLSNIPTYEQTPSIDTLRQDLGIAVNVKSNFNNGYIFKSGYITENEDVFDNNETNKYKGLDCTYVKGDKELSVYFEPQTLSAEKTGNQAGIIYKDCELVYYSYQNKFVPPNYKMTEQDKKDEKTGKYVFSYGSDKVVIKDVQMLR